MCAEIRDEEALMWPEFLGGGGVQYVCLHSLEARFIIVRGRFILYVITSLSVKICSAQVLYSVI